MNTENLYGMWISPKGDIWEIYKNVSSHEDMARQITGGIFPELDDFLPETKYLIMSGFCRVVFENSNNIVSMEFLEKLTRHQKEYLEIFREENRHVCEQWDNMTWGEFQEHSEKCYGFYPFVKYGEKLELRHLTNKTNAV